LGICKKTVDSTGNYSVSKDYPTLILALGKFGPGRINAFDPKIHPNPTIQPLSGHAICTPTLLSSLQPIPIEGVLGRNAEFGGQRDPVFTLRLKNFYRA